MTSLKKIGTRTAGRMLAIQGLYQMDITQKSMMDVCENLQSMVSDGHFPYLDEKFCDFALVQSILKGTVHNQKQIDVTIIKHLPEKWTISRLDKVICAILRAGLYELFYNTKENPAKIIIHEYTNMASAFGVNDNNHLIYGLLNKVATEENISMAFA